MDYLQNRNRFTDIKTHLGLLKGKLVGRAREFWINRYTLPYIKQENKDLLYSTRNYIQHLIITNNGKESKKVYTRVCIYIHIYIYKTMCTCIYIYIKHIYN